MPPVAHTMNCSRTPVRRSPLVGIVALVLAGLVATVAGVPAAQAATTATTLRDAATPHGLYVGTAVDYPFLSTDATYRATVAREFRQVTPGNEMKWDTIQPGPTTYDFTKADYIVNWASQNKLAVHGHTLLWHSQNPAWLTTGTFTKDQLLAVLHDHIATVVGHYKGKVVEWDVANEIMGDDGTLRHNLWYNTIGPEYIDDAFQWAHEADPGARLLLNDYNNQGKGKKSDAIYNLVASMKTRGIPIDGVGLQTHIGTSLAGSTSAMSDISWNMARLNALGLETDITEMDVALPLPSTPASLQTEATGFSGVLNACLVAANCAAFTTWGFTDKDSWIPAFRPGYGDALEFDAAYQPKPAYTSMLATLNGNTTVAPSVRPGNVSVIEGNSGTTTALVPIQLSAPSTKAVMVRYQTMAKTATAVSGDYVDQSGLVRFAPGETTKTVSISVNGDTTVEPDEQFFVVLSYASDANISWAFGAVTIVNDD
jgi:endo-1,4-beta-xylanase